MIVLLAVILLVASVLLFNKVLPGLFLAIILLMAVAIHDGSNLSQIVALSGNALLITFELALLILGSISFYRLLEHQGHFQDFSNHLQNKYSQVDILFLITWFLCTFLEGVAGFGVPALLIAPLMINLGYKPLSTMVLLLTANTLSVCYGALGTPIKIGLDINTPFNPFNTALSARLVLLMLIMPLVLIKLGAMLEPAKIKLSRQHLPLAIVAGLIPALILYFMSFYSLEFPTVIAGLSGFMSYLLMRSSRKHLKADLNYWYHFFKPYLLLVVILFIFRQVIGYAGAELGEGLRKVPYYQPGLLILLFAFFWFIFQSRPKPAFREFVQILFNSFKKSQLTLITIFLLVFLSGLMRKPVSELILNAGLPTSYVTLLAPIAGVLGSFTTGSLTMSNLMLSKAFELVLEQSGNFLQVMVLLHIGGALGNAISLQNIVMVGAVLPKAAPLRKVIGWNLLSVGFFVAILLLLYLF